MKVSAYLRGVAIAAMLAAAPLALSGEALALKGDVQLPAPYVSRALDAVLLPINNQVRKAFKLKKRDKGVLVLSVEPKGVAARRGIRPGDVLSSIKGRKIKRPIDVDIITYYWIEQGVYDFLIDLYRIGEFFSYDGVITRDEYFTVIDTTTISSWSSWETSTSFSYSEYYSEYSETITESYSSSETTIEQVSESSEFKESVENNTEFDAQPTEPDPEQEVALDGEDVGEPPADNPGDPAEVGTPPADGAENPDQPGEPAETTPPADNAENPDQPGDPAEATPPADSAEPPDEQPPPDNAETPDEQGEPPAVDEPPPEDQPAEEQQEEAPPADEPAEEAPPADEPAMEEPAADEPAAEEPAAEEPAAEEPAEEPAAEEPPPEDDGGGGGDEG
ncbi:MAG: hypothetical protein AB7S80_05180 [Rhizobiaceae bacterium]